MVKDFVTYPMVKTALIQEIFSYYDACLAYCPLMNIRSR